MLIRILYFFAVLFGFEILLSILLLRTFTGSLAVEYRTIIEYSDSLIKDTVLHISRYTEVIEVNEKLAELESYISRVTATHRGSRLLEISEIYILSTDGSILFHLKEPHSNYTLELDDKLPILMKALRMRRGQVELSTLERDTDERNTYLERSLVSGVPESGDTWILASAPLYLSGKMVVSGGIHVVFHRITPEVLIESRKGDLIEGFYWVLGLGLLGSFLLWPVFIYSSSRIVQERLAEESYEFHLHKEPEKKIQPQKQNPEKSSKSMDAVFLD